MATVNDTRTNQPIPSFVVVSFIIAALPFDRGKADCKVDVQNGLVADTADEPVHLVAKHSNRKSMCYDGHCAVCDKGRSCSSVGFLRNRRQGHNVPAEIVARHDHATLIGSTTVSAANVGRLV